MAQNLTDQIAHLGVVPVAALKDAGQAVLLADALSEGGLPVVEITFRTDAAEQAIKNIAAARPDILIGAGTVSTVEHADQAIDAGAAFIVAPGINPLVVEHAQKRGVPIFPGVCTPTDIETAINFGLSVLKFFPAGAYGGLKTLKALAGPYGHRVKFIPTGGIDADNLRAFLDDKSVLACGGSWLVASKLIDDGKFNEITTLTKEAVDIVKEAKGGRS